ncbi:MAG: NAD(P)H-hydrate dehydratase, partial [Candidatus Omnitrophica bacterium]|nr:NAD(P)H-hydrate dehydratase [Candidatus Omnitrophota bacterium]
MRLPAPLLRRDPRLHKYDFGHAHIIAGSKRMLGAAALTSLSALRSGAGLVT